MYKTFAAKYRITMTKAKLRYTKNREFKVPYKTKKGTNYAVFYNGGFCKIKSPLGSYADVMPEYEQMNKPKELFYRYKANICELCGAYVSSVKIYQVKSMNDISADTPWGAVMKKKQRKTLVVCEECYDNIHK